MTLPMTWQSLSLEDGWRLLEDGPSLRVRFTDDTCGSVDMEVRRSESGWLKDAYPVGAHDIECYCGCPNAPQALAAAVTAFASAAFAADSMCRRVVFSVDREAAEAIAAAQQGGLTCVVDVDVRGAQLALLVAEPDWCRIHDHVVDVVPDT